MKTPVRLDFLVCLDEGDEALLCLDTLKDLSIVSQNFPTPMDHSKRDYRTRRVVTEEEGDEEWLEEKEREEEQEKGKKQRERKTKEGEMFTLQERVGSLRSRIEFKEVNEEE